MSWCFCLHHHHTGEVIRATLLPAAAAVGSLLQPPSPLQHNACQDWADCAGRREVIVDERTQIQDASGRRARQSFCAYACGYHHGISEALTA